MSKRSGDPGYADGWCIHYRSSLDHETCEVGEAYEQFKNNPEQKLGWPCFTSHENPLPCNQRRLPTPEEIGLHEKWIEGRISDIGKAQAVIYPYRATHRGRRVEILPCPVCDLGKLIFSIASSNGHVHAKCTTENCIAFME